MNLSHYDVLQWLEVITPSHLLLLLFFSSKIMRIFVTAFFSMIWILYWIAKMHRLLFVLLFRAFPLHSLTWYLLVQRVKWSAIWTLNFISFSLEAILFYMEKHFTKGLLGGLAYFSSFFRRWEYFVFLLCVSDFILRRILSGSCCICFLLLIVTVEWYFHFCSW